MCIFAYTHTYIYVYKQRYNELVETVVIQRHLLLAPGLVVHTYNPRTQKAEAGGHKFKPACTTQQGPVSKKQNKNKKDKVKG
jgi:hypothetical protein